MTITLEHIYRYPVKGLGGQRLEEVQLNETGRIAYDRQWALTPASSPVIGDQSEWSMKQNFLTLVNTPRLAQLKVSFDETTQELGLYRKKRRLCQGKLTDPVGRMVINNFFNGFLGEEGRAPRLVEAQSPTEYFYDRKGETLSLINLDSLRDLESRLIREPVDFERFRGNLYVSGLPAWQELELEGAVLEFPSIAIKIIEPIVRCSATNVATGDNPQAGTHNLNIPQALKRGFGHFQCGVFVEVLKTGTLQTGMQGSLKQL